MRVLIVEDEVKLAKAVRRALELQNYAVDVVHDGEEALLMAMSEPFDLILLDIMLPSMDGFEVCRRLRAEKLNVPILMLTAKGQVPDTVAGLDAGADDYLVKPFSFEELFSRMRALLRRSSAADVLPLLKVRDLELNPATLEVKRNGQLIKLSAKEFAILEYLLRNPNTVLSKEKIVQHVWDYHADVLPSTVEVHMKHLRDKIDIPFDVPLLHTVRGFGYKISEENS